MNKLLSGMTLFIYDYMLKSTAHQPQKKKNNIYYIEHLPRFLSLSNILSALFINLL